MGAKALLDLDVEAVYVGAAPGYRLEKTAQASKRAGVGESAGAEAAEKTSTGAEAVGAVRRGEEGGGVERLLEDVRREFSGLPVYVGLGGLRLREEDCAYGQEAVQEVPRDVQEAGL